MRQITAQAASGVPNPHVFREPSLPPDFKDPDVHEAGTEMPVTLTAALGFIVIRTKQFDDFLSCPAFNANSCAKVGKHRATCIA